MRHTIKVLMKVKEYAEGWDSRRMLVGSVRAGDIVEACRDAVLRLEALSATNTAQQAKCATEARGPDQYHGSEHSPRW